MIGSKQFVCLLGSIAIMQGSGCASSYDRYSECQVNCQYCEPAPLPYPEYPYCVCHSAAANRYLTEVSTTADQQSQPVAVRPIQTSHDTTGTTSDGDEILSKIIQPISQITLD